MSRLLKITDLGSGIMVQGTDNVLYPDNATLTYPYNSIVVVTDESDIATFRSASNNDVLFSGLIGKIEIGGEIVTKQNINAKFDAVVAVTLQVFLLTLHMIHRPSISISMTRTIRLWHMLTQRTLSRTEWFQMLRFLTETLS